MAKAPSRASSQAVRRSLHRTNSYRSFRTKKAAVEAHTGPETPADGKTEGPAAAPPPPPPEDGAKLVSAAALRRVCRLPGVLLRSGLVYNRVTSLALQGQGIGDGDIPLNVGRLAGMLRMVDLSRNRLTELPPGLLQLGDTLEELNLGNNEIGELPPEVGFQEWSMKSL